MRQVAVLAAALATVTAGLSPAVVRARGAEIIRTDLSREALSSGPREASQVLVEFEPAASAPRHFHPGEELVFVVHGELEYTLDGDAPVVLKAGEVLFIPARAVHAVRNLTAGRSTELATYIVDPAEPLLMTPPTGAHGARHSDKASEK